MRNAEKYIINFEKLHINTWEAMSIYMIKYLVICIKFKSSMRYVEIFKNSWYINISFILMIPYLLLIANSCFIEVSLSYNWDVKLSFMMSDQAAYLSPLSLWWLVSLCPINYPKDLYSASRFRVFFSFAADRVRTNRERFNVIEQYLTKYRDFDILASLISGARFLFPLP